MDVNDVKLLVLDTLKRATSQDVHILKPAEIKLKEWEIEQGYYPLLLRIVSDHSIEVTIRWMAVTCLKNGVYRYWGKSALNAIAEEEKIILRNGLLTTIREPNYQIAAQLAVLISKAASKFVAVQSLHKNLLAHNLQERWRLTWSTRCRQHVQDYLNSRSTSISLEDCELDCHKIYMWYDYPHEWPELVARLLDIAKNEDPLMQHRGLMVLYNVIKTLSTKVLANDRMMFQQLAADIYSCILKFWNTNFEQFFSQVQNNDPQCQQTLEKALWSLKTLSKLTVRGFKRPDVMPHQHPDVMPHQHPDVMLFMADLFERAGKMLYFRKNIEHKSETLLKLTEKIIMHFIKILALVLDYFPLSFVNFIQPSLEFTFTFLFTEHGEGLLFENFIVQCMSLLRAIILCPKYKISKYKAERSPEEAYEATAIKAKFFQENNVLAEICRKLITRYFLLTRKDLQLWDSNPEAFEERATSDEAGEYGKVSFPACTYWLFVALFHEYRDSLSPVLMELIQKNHHFVSPQDMDAILRKDAVYNAIGLAGFDLYDEVDFDQWFLTILLQELSIKEPNYRVIRRRVAWLMGQWASIKLSAELRPALYRAFIPLLEAQEDMAVRLSAAAALKRAIDDFQFNSEQFMEFLEPTFSLLFNLLQEVEECDTKLQVLYVLSFIVERMGPAIKPYSQSLIRYLPLLWEQSSDHNMLRCAIVSILVRFVRGLITDNLTTFLCPVIELCTDLNQDGHVYLLEEGLELWYAVLDNINSLPPQLLQLYRAMPSVLGFTREYLQSCGFIIQAYILLSPQQFLVEYGESLVSSCMSLLPDLDDEGIAIILQVIDTAIRANASLAISLSMPMFPKILLLLDSGSYAMRKRSWLVSKFLEIICRVILFSRDIFFEVMVNTAREKSVTCEQFLEKVLSVWLPIMPTVWQKEKKKLLALGLSSLLPLGSDAVIAQFRVILGNLVEALNDIVDVEDSVQIDSIMVSEEFSPSEVEELESRQETENDRRRRLLMDTDPVYNVELKSYVQAQMNDLKLKLGAVNFEGLLRSVDQDTIEQCQFYIAF